jgi:hypothetical protein
MTINIGQSEKSNILGKERKFVWVEGEELFIHVFG